MKLLLLFLLASLIIGLRAGRRNEDIRAVHLLLISVVTALGYLSLRMV